MDHWKKMDRDNVISVQTGTGEHSHFQILETLDRKQYAYQFMKELDKNYRAHAGKAVLKAEWTCTDYRLLFLKSYQILIDIMFLCYFNI